MRGDAGFLPLLASQRTGDGVATAHPCLPSLRRLERDLPCNLVFAVGHQRSATTTVQQALVAALHAGSTRMLRVVDR